MKARKPKKTSKAKTAKTATAKAGVSGAELKKIALSFPQANETLHYGKPSFMVGKKFFTRLRAEDNSLVLVVGDIESRDLMLELDPKTYHITEHYRNYPAILVRMERIKPEEARAMLERRWCQIAPKKLVKEMEEKNVRSTATANPSKDKRQ